MSIKKIKISEMLANQEITPDNALGLIGQFNKSEVSSSQKQVNVYTKKFIYDEDILKDHKVFGEQILLGVMHCSLAIEVARMCYPHNRLHGIKRISFVEAIRLTPFEEVSVTVAITEENERVKFENTYQKTGQNQPRQTATGEFVFESSSDIAGEKVDIQSLCRDASKIISSDDLYKSQETYGPSLFTLRQVYYVQDGVIGEIQLSPKMRSQSHEYRVHPAILDVGCLCAFFSASLDHFGNDPCVPLFIKELYLFTDIPQPCYCYSKIAKQTKELLIADIYYYDREGNLVMYLGGLSLKRVSSKDALIGGSTLPLSTQNSRQYVDETLPRRTGNGFLEELRHQLEHYFSEVIKPLISDDKRLNKEQNFKDLGVDSLELIELSQYLENQFEIELSPALFFEYQNIKELAQYFSEKYKEVFSQYFQLQDSEKFKDQEILSQTEPQITGESAGKGIQGITDKSAQTVIPIKETDESKTVVMETTLIQRDIAIIGMAGMFADSPDMDAFWKNLREKKDMIREIPPDHFNYQPWFDQDTQKPDKMYCKWGSFIGGVDTFDASFFNITPKEAEVMDPQLRLLLQVLYSYDSK